MSLFTFCLKVGTITHVVCGTYPDVLSLFFSEVSDDESCHCLSLRFLPGLQIHCTVLYVILSTWFSVKLAGHCVEVWVAIKVLWAVMIGRCEPPSHLSSPPRSGALPVSLKAPADGRFKMSITIYIIVWFSPPKLFRGRAMSMYMITLFHFQRHDHDFGHHQFVGYL